MPRCPPSLERQTSGLLGKHKPFLSTKSENRLSMSFKYMKAARVLHQVLHNNQSFKKAASKEGLDVSKKKSLKGGLEGFV